MNEQTKSANHDIFKSVGIDVSKLHMYWSIYRQLYAHSDQRILLLNESGSMVFYVLQHLLLDEVTLAICRLTDPTTTGRRENHSLERLVFGIQDDILVGKLKSLIQIIRPLAKPFRERRNRAIAHSDLETKLKVETNPLPGISRQMIEDTLKAIRALMNAYDCHYFNNTTMYEDVILPSGADGNFLSQQLRRAVAYTDLERSGPN